MTGPREPKKSELVTRPVVEPERFEQEAETVEVGQWYWVDESQDKDDIDPNDEEEREAVRKPWIGCIIHIGSNYVEVESPQSRSLRIHIDAFNDYLTRELDAQSVLGGKVQHYKDKVTRLMGEVQEVTARLGVSPRVGITQKEEHETHALVRITGDQPDPKTYKNALVKAKEETLPELFKKIEKANEELSVWMKAEMLPLKAQTEGMKDCVEKIEGRIFNVSLYAGLTEEITQVCDGEPAPFDAKLHLMQRRCYMDEECLLDYQAGGMEFRSMDKFDRWMAKPKNLDRLLPFPRCMIAMRVRRKKKERESDGSALAAFINFKLAQLDTATFLYIRNGEQLYRMNCDLEFNGLIFPNRGEFDMTQPMMFRCGSWGDEIFLITRSDYEVRIEKHKQAVKDNKRWKKENPIRKWAKANPKLVEDRNTKWAWENANPYTNDWGSLIADNPEGQWEEFNRDSLYYDEAISDIKERVDYYNRLSLIIQGLYDRSPVLHPHPPVKTWTSAGFMAAVELIYDSDRVLHAGEKPSFENYRDALRESIDGESVVIGQEDVWREHVQDKEEERRRNSYHYNSYRDVYGTWKPDGDNGPGFVARIARFQAKAGKATFRWMRERRGKTSWGCHDDGDLIMSTFSVEIDKLFNVSAYKPGDFLQFFQDPRTRAEYIRWAPFLLSAEDYHAGKLEAQEPAVGNSSEPSLTEIADRIQVHLSRMEGDKRINKNKGASRYDAPFYSVRSRRRGRFCEVRYDYAYRGYSLTKGEAWKYLQWLDAGNNGKHRKQQKEARKAKEKAAKASARKKKKKKKGK